MPLGCIVVGLMVATATETTIYMVNTDVEITQQVDLKSEVARIARRDRRDVQAIRELPGLPERARTTRCGFEPLYATLTGAS